jgi:hypothetical protein
MINIFYSWQSDSPSSTNRNFIKSALEKTIQSLKKGSEDIQVEMRVDTATDALPGSPDIAASIFEKISNSQIFLCDVTIINSPSTVEKIIRSLTKKIVRQTPNPNVLVELGFAVSCLGWDKIICVVNTAQGKVEDLPFDIRGRRMCAYRYPDSSKSKEEIKSQLVGTLKYALIDIIGSLEAVQNIELINVIISKKFCDRVNYLGVFLNYFLADELGHEAAEGLVNNSVCTVVEHYDPASVDSIISVFTKKNLDEPSNLPSSSGERASWKEFFIVALEKISNESEILLMKYGSSGDQTLIYELERIKDFTGSVIGAAHSNDSKYMKETYADEVRRKVYAESTLKPYFLELIGIRMLAIRYLSSPSTTAKIQPKVLPGETLKIQS